MDPYTVHAAFVSGQGFLSSAIIENRAVVGNGHGFVEDAFEYGFFYGTVQGFRMESQRRSRSPQARADLEVRRTVVFDDRLEIFNSVNGKGTGIDGTEYEVRGTADLIQALSQPNRRPFLPSTTSTRHAKGGPRRAVPAPRIPEVCVSR